GNGFAPCRRGNSTLTTTGQTAAAVLTFMIDGFWSHAWLATIEEEEWGLWGVRHARSGRLAMAHRARLARGRDREGGRVVDHRVPPRAVPLARPPSRRDA